MKKTYASPEMKIVAVKRHDVIATSGAVFDVNTTGGTGVAESPFMEEDFSLWD